MVRGCPTAVRMAWSLGKHCSDFGSGFAGQVIQPDFHPIAYRRVKPIKGAERLRITFDFPGAPAKDTDRDVFLAVPAC